MADDRFPRPPRPQNPYARPQDGQRGQPRAGNPSRDPLAELARLIGEPEVRAPRGSPAQHAPGLRGERLRVAPPFRSGHEPGLPQTPSYRPPVSGTPFQPEQNYQQPPAYREPSQSAFPFEREQDAAEFDAPAYDDDADAGYSADQRYPQDESYYEARGEDDFYGAPARQDYPSQEYPAQDYAAQNYPSQDYSRQDYSRQDYSRQDYSRQDYPQQDSGSRETDARAYAEPPFSEPPFSTPQSSAQQFPAQHFPAQQFPPPQFASPEYEGKPYPAYDNQFYFPQSAEVPHTAPYAGHPPAVPEYEPAEQHFRPPHPSGLAGYEDRPRANEWEHREQVAAFGTGRLLRGRGALRALAALLVLAVLGTAGVYGYRSIFSAKNSGPPPLITADGRPSKIVPGSGDAKPIQDRIGEGEQVERLVPRQEQPVDVNAAVSSSAPDVQSTADRPSTEPKKVRTIPIRSDQPELAAVASAAANAAGTAPAPVAPPGIVAPTTSNAAPVAQPAPAARPAPVAPPMQTAPAQQAPAPARTAALPAAGTAADGSYGAQVSAQRSENEARAAFTALQAKFPDILGGRQLVIRRADLGEKGIFYRAQVPFDSQSAAAEFCASLRSAGGQCLVQKN